MNAEELQLSESKFILDIPADALVIIPSRNRVLYPAVTMPFIVRRPGRQRAVEETVRQKVPIGFVCQRDPSIEVPELKDLHEIGTAADVLRMFVDRDGERHIVVKGRRRFHLGEFIETDPVLIARVVMVEEQIPGTKDFEARILRLRQEAGRALSLFRDPLHELRLMIEGIEDPLAVIDLTASILDVPTAEKQEILALLEPEARAQRVSEKLERQIELMELSRKIGAEANESMDKSQRQYFLRAQLKVIQNELGEEDGEKVEAEELRRKVEEAKMPPDIERESFKQLNRLERIPEISPEHSLMRTYFDWLVDLPWSVFTTEEIDLLKAREILDADHHGLEKVKKRIIEFLAVRKLMPQGKSPILCLVGPPGVGKTSLGQSIARAMNRKFVRQSLGGVHDEADIRGHRRTYIGALPGNIIQGIRKAGSRNPVFMLDEVDKLSASFHGNPSAALLEVLDPSQNATFQDHYLAVPFDLSQVLFIATANVLDTVPGPLRDRMEILELPGYVEDDKLAIAKGYLVPRQISENGLNLGAISYADDAIQEIIRTYTRESGVRQLERELGAICRSVATRVAAGSKEMIFIKRDSLDTYLGPPKFFNELALRTSLPGVATGLAWTPFGGDILFIEAMKMRGSGKLLLTGQLGAVMKESAQAALSLIKSGAETLGIDPDLFRKNDLHIHIPAGAIPKDGPSAGITLFVALVSLLTGRRINKDFAMTGEISLRGLVLPVGGIKEKVLAAKRAGISCVLLPEYNRRDLEEISPAGRAGIRFQFLTTADEALRLALEPEAPGGFPASEELAAPPIPEQRVNGTG
jgi:ATP-dependent Lon protease